MSISMRRLRAVAAVGAASLVLTACSGDDASPGDGGGGTELSGSVVWYSSKAPEYSQAVIDDFNEEYPNIRVDMLRAPSGDLTVRYAQERSSGAETADLITMGDIAFVDEGRENDWWVSEPQVSEGFPEEHVVDGMVTVGMNHQMLAYNTNTFPEGADMDSWEVLADPDMAGRVILLDPRGEPGYLGQLQLYSELYGDEFLEQLASQDIRWVNSQVPGFENLGSGSGDVMAPAAFSSGQPAIDSGAPVDLNPNVPSTAIGVYTVQSNEAHDEAATSAFFEFLTSKEGQETFHGQDTSSVRTDTEGTAPLPDDLIPMEDLLPEALERRDELMALVGLV
ncbi:extracellular solute-binding protein [Citricoccus sp. NPDC055426]|uniref:extracellular solute-binding protein n=1 Tax=Citricoccus sp. NPDC055426 TaxID=3155536 RepID=UPI003421A2DD